MNGSLTPQPDVYMQEKVKTGMCHSANEVIREGLRLLREQDDIRDTRIAQLRRDFDLGIEQIASCQYTEYTSDNIKDLDVEIKAKGRQVLAWRG